MVFEDRRQAGRLLAERLERLRARHPVVLGLARGGVPVAAEVARALGAELDVLVVRKLGAPGWPEYALGAVAEGGAACVRHEALGEAGVSEEDVAAIAEREAAEVARRVRLYRGDRPPIELAGRTVVVVDDGVATGATARAAARAARQRGAARVILAAPVIAAATAPELRADADEVVAVDFPEPFMAVGLWYRWFPQVSDEEVVACLHRAGEEVAADPWGGEWLAGDADPSEPEEERAVVIPFDGSPHGPGVLDGELSVPEGATGLVALVHGSGSSRRSPRNRLVAAALRRAGIGTLLFDLLTPAEAIADEVTGRLRFDVDLLAGRTVAAVRWLGALPGTRALRLGCFGASTGAAAALAAAAELPERVAAVVSRGGRPDLVPTVTLERVRAPVLLVVGARDEEVLRLNRAALPHLAGGRLAVVPGATHLFEEPGALDAAARLATGWFARWLATPAALEARAPA